MLQLHMVGVVKWEYGRLPATKFLLGLGDMSINSYLGIFGADLRYEVYISAFWIKLIN